jgi:hypothetical protein
MKRYLCAFVVALAVCTRSAAAQGLSFKSLELSVSEAISYHTKKQFEIGPPQSTTPIEEEMRLDTGHRHEVRLNFLTTKHIGSEAFYTYGSTNVVFTRQTAPGDSLSIPIQLHHFGVSILYYPTGEESSKWRPFIAVGGGAKIYRPTGEGQDIATDPLRGNLSSFFESSRGAFNYGVGVKRSLGRSFGLRIDLGNVVTAAPTFGLPTEATDLPNANVLPVSGKINNPHASVGIILYLGR